MAIKIPSKNIYQIDNNKVIDNKIGELTIEENLDAFFEETIYSANFNFWQPNNKGEDVVTGYDKENKAIMQFFPYKINDLKAYDNVAEQNEIKAEISGAIHENDVNLISAKRYYSFYSIKFPIEQQIKKDTLKVVFNTNYGTFIDAEFQFVKIKGSALFDEWYKIDYEYSPYVSLNYDYAKIEKYTNKEDFINTYLTKNADNSYTVSNVDNYNGINYNVIIGLNQKEYEIEIYLLLKTDKSGRNATNPNLARSIEELVKNFNLRITAEVLKQEKNVISILQNEKNKTFKLPTNELLQAENTYKNEKLNTYVANKILSSYKDGKETAILLCDLDNYYDFESGVKVIDISGEKKTFDIYDKVIPTVLDINGTNKPISYYKNDTALLPKEFQVLKHKIIYNGMLKQELQCQETELGKDNYLIYEINFTVGRYNQNESDKGAKFKIKGKGDIYINDIFYNSFDYSTAHTIEIPYENINAETANFKFVGNFSQISTTSYYQTSGGSDYQQGQLNSIIQWDSRYFKTFEEQFRYQTLLSDFEIPSNIETINVSTFSLVKSQYLITIPKSVKTIEKKAFAYNGLTSIKFLHGENDTINLPTAGDINGAFYSKNAYNLTIYTDNLMIKNYDWATDNVTPTFYHLDGTLWE